MKIYIALTLLWEESLGPSSGAWEIDEKNVKLFRKKSDALDYGDNWVNKNDNASINILEKTIEETL